MTKNCKTCVFVGAQGSYCHAYECLTAEMEDKVCSKYVETGLTAHLELENKKGKNMSKKKEVIDYEPATSEDFALPLLTEEMTDKTFEIEQVRFDEGRFGEYAVLIIEGKDYRTSSVVLLKQLHSIQEIIAEKDVTVRVTLKRVKRYYTF